MRHAWLRVLSQQYAQNSKQNVDHGFFVFAAVVSQPSSWSNSGEAALSSTLIRALVNCYTGFRPSGPNGFLLVAADAEELASDLEGQDSRSMKTCPAAQSVTKCDIPDLPRLLPRMPANLSRNNVEGMVRDSRIVVSSQEDY